MLFPARIDSAEFDPKHLSSVLIGMFLNHVHLLPVLLSTLSIAGAQSPTSSLGGIVCDPNLLKIGLCQNGYPLAVQLVAIPCQQTITPGQSATPCIPLLPCINYAPGQLLPSLPNSNSTELPHQPPCASHTVTPYPPVAALPGNTETKPGGSPSTVKPDPPPCSNYSVTPYPPIAAQPGNSESDPGASHATNPNGNEGSFTPPCAEPVTTTTTPAPPCVTPSTTATTPATPSLPPSSTTTPAPPSLPPSSTTTPAPPSLPPSSPTTPAPPSLLPSSPPAPAPEELRSCPAGTVLRNGACRQIYCASGAYVNGRCVRVHCPAGTTWTGDKCASPKPKEFEPIRLKPIVIEATQNLSLSNELNPMVNEFISIQQSQSDYEDEDEEEEEDESEEALPAPSGNSSRCCNVISPRTCRCKTGSDQWKCYNRRQQLCGDFCVTSKLVLKPSAVQFWQEKDEQILLMPPNWNVNCQGNCPTGAARYDCSGCAFNLATACSPYCFNYICNSPNCSFQDQQEFCESGLITDTSVCPSANGWV